MDQSISTWNPTGLYSLCRREVIRFLIVAHQTIFPPLISSLLFLFIFGLSVGKQIQLSNYEISYITFIVPGIITMHLITASFENTSSSLFISNVLNVVCFRWKYNRTNEEKASPNFFWGFSENFYEWTRVDGGGSPLSSRASIDFGAWGRRIGGGGQRLFNP